MFLTTQANPQLKAVLLTLLEELPYDLPMLLLGTTSVFVTQLDEGIASIFTHRNVYEVEKPTKDNQTMYFDQLIEAIFSVPSEEASIKSKEANSISELPKVPKADSGPKASEVRAKVEAE
ncbi:hypothetical protein ACHQM5_025940 [Ranunculus cassubicifolius]